MFLDERLSNQSRSCLKPKKQQKGSNEQLPQDFPQSLAPLDRIGWLSQCSEPLQAWFAKNGRWLNVETGASLFRESDSTDGMYGVASGAVDVEYAPDGLEDVVVVRVSPGNWLGHGCLQTDMPRPFNLIAASESKIFFVARPALRQLLDQEPRYWQYFHELGLKQVLGLMTVLCETHTLTPEARLSRLLLRLSVHNPTIEMRQTDLITLLGMSHSNVRRSLKSLAEANAIETGYNKILVLDRHRLELISRQPR